MTTFGELARTLLSQISKHKGDSIHHVLFDTYKDTSIKANERHRRNNTDREYLFTGSDQAPRVSPAQLLKNGQFKEELAKFLMREWKK